MPEILVEIIIDLFGGGWLSWLGARIRFYTLRIFKEENELREKIFDPDGVLGSLTQGFYNAVVGFFVVALIVFGIVWGYFY